MKTELTAKVITAVWSQRGRRRKLEGFIAEVDGYELPDIFPTQAAASAAADEFIFDDLSRAGLHLIGKKVA